MMKSLVRLTFLTVLLSGCYQDSVAPVPEGLYGRYVLRTVADQPVPAVYSEQPNFKLEFIRGVIVLREDLTFTDSTEIRRTEFQIARRTIDVASGSYTQEGNTINLSSTRGERYAMTLNGRSLTQTLNGVTLTYRK